MTSWSYIRTMWLILWYAFRHPFMTTEIDIVTGEIRIIKKLDFNKKVINHEE